MWNLESTRYDWCDLLALVLSKVFVFFGFVSLKCGLLLEQIDFSLSVSWLDDDIKHVERCFVQLL